MANTQTREAARSRFGVRTKLISAFVVVLGLFFIATAASFWFANKLDEARAITEHTYDVLVSVSDMRSGMWAQESGLRGYVISNDTRFLETFTDGSQRFEKSLNQARRLTTDNPSQQARLSQVAILENRWQAEVVKPEFELLQQGRIEEAQQVISDGEGETLLASIRSVFSELSLAEYQLLAERAGRFSKVREAAIFTMLVLLCFGFVVGVLAIFWVSRQVTRPLGVLTDTMGRIANNELTLDVPFQTRRDEVGAISAALEHFRHVSITNDAIAWVRQNLEILRSNAQQAHSEAVLAQGLLDNLAPMVKARYAALFVRDEQKARYVLTACYGFSAKQDRPQSYADHEGLVGQCAYEREMMLLDDLPDGYINIESGLGTAKPSSVILVPAVYRDETYAVLELALFEPWRDRYAKLLEELMPTTALSLATLKRHVQTQELLEETNAQSEELRASEEELRSQQEALRATNDNLRQQSEEIAKQAQALRASEEELKVQSEELQATNEELLQSSDVLKNQKRDLERAQIELQDKAQALTQASQYKSEFLANMSHELRTPLNSLLILARSLADNENGHLDSEEVEAATIVHDSGANLLRLINDILDLSKVEAGKMQAHVEGMSLPAFAERVRRNFQHVADKKGLGFDVSIASDVPEIMQGDAGKLEQIINNLLANAFKFTQQGAVSMQITRPPETLEIRTPGLTADNAVCFAVVDQGIGIADDKRDKIFQAFEQVDSSTSRVYGGTGLGLSISQRLTQLLGGEIHLHSVKNKGSTFTVIVPQQTVVAAGPAQADETPEPETPAIAPIKPIPIKPQALPDAVIADDRETLQASERSLLIIEDDSVFAAVLRDSARRKGFKCILAADGEAGLVLAKKYRPTGILLDIGLPGIDGWAVLDQLKSQDETRHIPVHILSAADDTGRGAELGAIGYLPKPAERDGLESVFARVLEAADGARKRLLVVDDDAAARTAIKTLLKKENTKVDFSGSAEECLAALAKTAYDCVVLDLNLPDMSGFDLLEKIKSKDAAPPVVVYSGRELSDDENLRLRQHTDSIVVKGSHSTKRLLDEVNLFMHSIREQTAKAEPLARNIDTELAGKTVLLVDDDMRNTFALSRVLRGKGLKVLMAQDGYKALDQLERQAEIDIVLMDIMMPGIDGYETMRRIRAQQAFAQLPILALTAKAMKGDREKCIEAGANDYLSKPIDTEKLLSMMRAWT